MKIVGVTVGSGILLAGALLVSACGGSSGGGGSAQLTLGKEYPAMKAAAKAATSVRMSGSIVQGGKLVSLDLALVKPGWAAGSLSQGGRRYTIVVTRQKDYIKISKLFLRVGHLPAKVCAKACGQYVEVPAASDPSFSKLSMTNLINEVFSKPPSTGEAAIRLTTGRFQGQPAWVGSGGGETFYLAKGSVPYLLSISKHGQRVDFSGWNTATVSPPPASQVLTVYQLGVLAAG